MYYINAERVLIHRHEEVVGWNIVYDYREIASDVDKVFGDSGHVFFIKTNGSLWGVGQNANGELGDGTRVPRDEPVHIADNVIYARAFAFLKQDGTFWTWNTNNPTPQQVLENVAVVANGVTHFQDGRATVDFGGRNEAEFDNVRVPRTITFD